MEAGRFDEYLEGALVRFAHDFAASSDLSFETALAKARDHVAGLLEDGMATSGHHFRTLVVDGAPAGTLWFAEQLEESPPRVYLYDIAVDEARRGQGIGTRALHALEEEARALGARAVMLSVFHHNTGAVRLYERLGYEPHETGAGGMRMVKSL